MTGHPLPIIIGIDPGTTAAVAVLDTDGALLSLRSGRNLSLKGMARHVSGLGRPVIVATDRNPAPSSVEKLAATFSARLVVPEENLSKREKNLLAREFTEGGSGSPTSTRRMPLHARRMHTTPSRPPWPG